MPTLRPLRPCTLTTSHSGRIQLRCPLAVTEYRRATTTTGARRNSACKTWGRRLQLQPRSRGWKSASTLQSGDVCLLLTITSGHFRISSRRMTPKQVATRSHAARAWPKSSPGSLPCAGTHLTRQPWTRPRRWHFSDAWLSWLRRDWRGSA